MVQSLSGRARIISVLLVQHARILVQIVNELFEAANRKFDKSLRVRKTLGDQTSELIVFHQR